MTVGSKPRLTWCFQWQSELHLVYHGASNDNLKYPLFNMVRASNDNLKYTLFNMLRASNDNMKYTIPKSFTLKMFTKEYSCLYYRFILFSFFTII